ncbi:MAG: hypothetical protein ABI724_07175 [Betaproteobacteria bacterium]
MAAVTLAAGLLLPWLLGMAVVLVALRIRRPPDSPGGFAWIAGIGYLVGALLLTLWMRVLSMAGIRFGALPIALPLLVVIVAIGLHLRRRDGDAWRRAIHPALRALVRPSSLYGGALLAWRLLLALVAVRFVVLGLDVAWQPLYPWEAWVQWATKARVWFELGRIVPFAGSDAWFSAGGRAYFDAAPDVPPTLPLLQVWSCISLDRWDDALMNWPWWQMAVALACAVYGALRSLGLSALSALVVTYLVASMPLANVHVALAGYADLPLAAYYTCAVLSFLRWVATRDTRDAAIAALLAFACIDIKNPGLVWALTLVPGAIVAMLPRIGLRIAATGLAAGLFLLAVVAQTSTTILGYTLHLEFAPAWTALWESYFLSGNWNLLWFGVIAAAILAGRQLASPALAPMTIVVAGGAIVLFTLFAFPHAAIVLADQTTFNRASLHFAPVAMIFAALAFRAFAVQWTRTAADGPSS